MTKLFASVLLSLVCFNIFPKTAAICRYHYITMCSNFEDVDKYHDSDSWRELLIGKTQRALYRRGYTSVNLGKFLNKFNRLQVLMITEKINRLEKFADEIHRCAVARRLEFLNLFGNELRRIEKHDFPRIYITRLRLVNNKITEIKKGAFYNHRIKILDLSSNFLRYIEKGSLPGTSSTKSLSIKNNRLIHLEPGSCPPHLSILNLDRNYLSNLTGVLDNLKYLEELTLSHNKFVTVPNITHLARLKILDLSFNDITDVDGNYFKKTNNLEILNFGYNQLWNPDFLAQFVTENKQRRLVVSVVFNQISTVNLNKSEDNRMVNFLSYGNPWNCSEWKIIGNNLLSYEQTCGLRFYSSGVTPYCVHYDSQSTVFSSSSLNQHVKKFHYSINKNKRLVGCNLEPRKSFIGCGDNHK